jgi:anti-sigma regulatory factor (Ser/Thr protein kinase)
LQLQVSFEDVPEVAVGDETRIRQVLMNLVSNAVKFTEVGSVTLSVTSVQRARGEMELEICVRDTGIGIPEDRQSKLFGKFSQVDGSTTRRYGGTGLGLFIAKSLVLLMRGTISVTSTVGEGSCFRIAIPIALPAVEEGRNGAPGPESDTTASVARPCVLIAEDNRTNQLVLTKSLQRLGFEVDVAEDGAAAVERWKHRPYRSYPDGLPDARNGWLPGDSGNPEQQPTKAVGSNYRRHRSRDGRRRRSVPSRRHEHLRSQADQLGRTPARPNTRSPRRRCHSADEDRSRVT